MWKRDTDLPLTLTRSSFNRSMKQPFARQRIHITACRIVEPRPRRITSARTLIDSMRGSPLSVLMAFDTWCERQWGGKRRLLRHVAWRALYLSGGLRRFQSVEWARVHRLIFVC